MSRAHTHVENVSDWPTTAFSQDVCDFVCTMIEMDDIVLWIFQPDIKVEKPVAYSIFGRCRVRVCETDDSRIRIDMLCHVYQCNVLTHFDQHHPNLEMKRWNQQNVAFPPESFL